MENKIDIYRPDGSVLETVTYDTNSYRRWQVMGEHAVTLNFSWPGPVNEGEAEEGGIPVGSYIYWPQNDERRRQYTLYNPADFTKNGTRNFAYTLKLHAYQALMDDSIFINQPDGRTSFSRQARPLEFLEALVWNMNREDSGWTVGAYVDTNVQQNIQFNETTCSEALRLMADAFKTEWEVNGKTISLRKVEYFKDNDAALKLSYGGGQERDAEHGGFRPGLGRGNFDASRPIHRLFVSGGDRNINFTDYGSQTLLLPKNATIRYDGSKFEGENGYNAEFAREYQASADGHSLVRINAPQTSKREASVDLNNIYPMREGEITAVKWIFNGSEHTTYQSALNAAKAAGKGAGDIFCDVLDTSIPSTLDYSQYRLDGEQLVFAVQTGRLAGRELGIQQDADGVSGYVHSQRRFKLLTEADGGAFIPGDRLMVGDKYAIFGMSMPNAYINSGNDTKQGGEWDLLREAVRYKYENEEPRFTFKGELDGIWAHRNWNAIEDKIVPGGYVLFSDPQFQPEGKLIRISAIKEYLHEPYKPEIELTNIVIGGGLRGELAEIPRQEVVIDEQQRTIARLEQRRWRDVQELRGELSKVFTEFSQSISPVSVETMQLIAGSEMGQFRFVSGTTDPIEEKRPTIRYSDIDRKVQIYEEGTDGGPLILQHMTLGLEGMITGPRDATDYTFWTIEAYPPTILTERDKLYWVYVRVPKYGTTGNFEVTTEIYSEMDNGGDFYYFVVGALNSEYGGERSWSPLYGFTEVLPGQITTPLIRSNDGRTYFDLVEGEIGGNITFVSTSGKKNVTEVDAAATQAQNYINNTLPGIISDINTQIDGKVETWYQTNDPSTAWTTAALRTKHTGDMWYNSSTKLLKRYTGSTWTTIEDKTALDAHDAASKAQDTADGKRTVFVEQPKPPYEKGDLWTDGTDLKRCNVARSTGSYISSDWGPATSYDNTKTSIDGGLITSGTIQVVGGTKAPTNNANSKAGITGYGTEDSSVRMWAGNTFANRTTAPFRVQQDGSLFATKASIAGNVRIEGSVAQPWVLWNANASPNQFQGDEKGLSRFDNIAMPTTSNITLSDTQFSWRPSDSGRVIRICQYKWNNQGSSYNAFINAPAGKYFFENGKQYSSLRVARELITLVGYGTPTTFYGWIVQSRTLVMPSGTYGAYRRVLYQGYIFLSPTQHEVRLWSADLELGHAAEEIWYIERMNAGKYKVWLPISLSANYFQVYLHPTATNYSGSRIATGNRCFATVTEKGRATHEGMSRSYFDVWTADDPTPNESPFMFEVIGTYDWREPIATEVMSAAVMSDGADPVLLSVEDLSVDPPEGEGGMPSAEATSMKENEDGSIAISFKVRRNGDA